MITLQQEPLTDELWDEAAPLLVAHWREIAHYQDIPLNPDLATYRGLAAQGAIRIFTARETVPNTQELNLPTRGTLVGYALYIVRHNNHYRESLQAVQDVLYLAPRVRGGTGYKFINWCDLQLKAEGVQVVYQHVKAAHDFGKILTRMGYSLVDHIYGRRLD